jgi:hypothetical protein
MSRFARVVCMIYGATALFLAYATVEQALNGEVWAVAALAACSLVPLIGLMREVEHSDAVANARALVERACAAVDSADRPPLPRRTPGADGIVAVAMAAACCEVWWSTAGAQHDPATCTRKDHHA